MVFSKSNYTLQSLDCNLAMGCKLNCKYCPQGLLLKNYYREDSHAPKFMELENFKKIVEKIDPRCAIAFAGASEPFSNPHAIDMMEHAYHKGFKIGLFTTLMHVSQKTLERLKNINFVHIVLHVPDKEGNSHFEISPQYFDNLRFFVNNFTINYYSCHGTIISPVLDIIREKQPGCTQNVIGDISDIHDRAGNLENVPSHAHHPLNGRICCMRGSQDDMESQYGWNPMLLPDGRLLLCCNDYGMKYVIGNLLNQSWEEIRDGQVFNDFINDLADNPEGICRNCYSAIPFTQMPSQIFKSMLLNAKNLHKIDKHHVLEKINSAKAIAIIGLGELFFKQYFSLHWDEVFNAEYFIDNNPAMWGKNVENTGKYIQSIDSITNVDDVLFIEFVKNSAPLDAQLDALSANHISIMDIFHLIQEYMKS